MKTIRYTLLLLLMSVPLSARADLIEEEPTLTDNTGALGVASEATTSVDIIADASATGTKEGEITLFKNDAGVEIYSGLAKVEVIPTGSDGWTGALVVGTGDILYTPAGRPQLSCPAQALANWYGPCKIATAE